MSSVDVGLSCCCHALWVRLLQAPDAFATHADGAAAFPVCGCSNVLPASVDVQRDYFSESSRSAVRAAFSTWSLDECQAWLADGRQGLGLQLSLEEETGKFFPSSNSSAEVRDRLLAACARHGVGLRYGAAVVGLHQQQQQEEGEKGSGGEARGGWRCVLQDGSQLAARRVILATGGKSYPTLGTTGDGWRLLEQLGHTLHAPYPALTPLLGTHPGQAQLAGISLYSAQVSVSSAATGAGGNGSGSPRQGSGRGAKARQLQQAERSDLLFTHRGWSGPGEDSMHVGQCAALPALHLTSAPSWSFVWAAYAAAILDVSHHMAMAMDRGQPLPAVSVRWTHDDATAWDRHLAAGSGGAALVPHVLRRHGLPHRLAEALVVEVGLPPDRKVAELRRGERQALLEALAGWLLPVSSHGGFAKAEVTGGGLPLEQVNCRTLESRLRPGLHIVGELLDVTGRVGGFNFFWAFLTGRAAGLAAAAVPAERG